MEMADLKQMWDTLTAELAALAMQTHDIKPNAPSDLPKIATFFSQLADLLRRMKLLLDYSRQAAIAFPHLATEHFYAFLDRVEKGMLETMAKTLRALERMIEP